MNKDYSPCIVVQKYPQLRSRLIPVESNRKVPAIDHITGKRIRWSELGPIEDDSIEEWFATYNNCNWGYRLGGGFNDHFNLVVVNDYLADNLGADLPETEWVVDAGDGRRHYYFDSNDIWESRMVLWSSGHKEIGQCMCYGSYVVAPHSFHSDTPYAPSEGFGLGKPGLLNLSDIKTWLDTYY